MAFVEFCCRSGGNNLNAGTLNGSSTEPAVTAVATYTGGDWNGSNIYTAPIGANLTEVIAGRYVAICPDGSTVPVSNSYSIHQILSVNSGTREITVRAVSSYYGAVAFGTVMGSRTGNTTLRIGGAWQGPNGANTFPFNGMNWSVLSVFAGSVRTNLKNDQTYNVTTTLTGTGWNVMGYAAAFGDAGRATIDGGTSGASYVLFTTNFGYSSVSGSSIVADLVFQNNGATGSAGGVVIGSSAIYGLGANLVVKNMRGIGLLSAGYVFECESFSNVGTGISAALAVNCISHTNTGSGYATSGRYLNCIAHHNTVHGFWGYQNSSSLFCEGCDSYMNGVSGFFGETVNTGSFFIRNCNAVQNSGHGILIASQGGNANFGVTLLNCGTYGNTLGSIVFTGGTEQVYLNSGHVAYASNPYVDAANGDFRLNIATAKNAGRGRFVQTASGYSGAVSYPDIGACQSIGGSSKPQHPMSQQVIG